jgi:RNA polymerase sigma factor (sigma-70 family)
VGTLSTRVEVSSLRYSGAAGGRGPTPLLRLQGDERLVALTRRGNQAAYEALVARYQARLLAFCRHMLSSREDAEDVLQEVFAAAFNAMLADERPINVRPWLYRIARNRCLNHLRKQTAIGVDSMDIHLAEHGTTTADKVHDREDFRQLVADVQTLAETQRTALLLREIDALSYEQIAEAMETTVPSVKSLLVRARVALAEAAEARRLTCEEVRGELGEWSEGLARISAPVRRHVRGCQRCGAFKKQLRQTNKALAAVFPVGPLLLLKKFILAQGAGAAAGGAAATGGVTVGGATAGGALSAGVGAVATKAAAGLAAVAIVTTGVAEVDHVQSNRVKRQAVPAQVIASAPPHVVTSHAQAPAPAPAPIAVSSKPQKPSVPAQKAAGSPSSAAPSSTVPATAPVPVPVVPSTTAPAATTSPSASAPSTTAPTGTQEGYDNTRLPDQPATGTGTGATTTPPASPIAAITPAPADPTPPTTTAPAQPAPADPAPSPPSTTAPAAPADPAPPADSSSTTPPTSTAPATASPEPATSSVPAQ